MKKTNVAIRYVIIIIKYNIMKICCLLLLFLLNRLQFFLYNRRGRLLKTNNDRLKKIDNSINFGGLKMSNEKLFNPNVKYRFNGNNKEEEIYLT